MRPADFTGHRARVVVGLPGSGKTHYARSLGHEWTLIDDPESPADLPDDFAHDVVITSPHFCREVSYQFILNEIQTRWPGITVETVFFANDPDACLLNAATRPHKPVSEFIRFLSKDYDPPADAMPVWRPSVGPAIPEHSDV